VPTLTPTPQLLMCTSALTRTLHITQIHNSILHLHLAVLVADYGSRRALRKLSSGACDKCNIAAWLGGCKCDDACNCRPHLGK
jgi:hypothetical protein